MLQGCSEGSVAGKSGGQIIDEIENLGPLLVRQCFQFLDQFGITHGQYPRSLFGCVTC